MNAQIDKAAALICDCTGIASENHVRKKKPALPCVRGANKPEFGNKPIKDVRQDYTAGCRGGQYLRSLRLELKDWKNIRSRRLRFASPLATQTSNRLPQYLINITR